MHYVLARAAGWQLGISVDKCNVVFIGKGDSTSQFCITLPVVTECRDLGITITHDLSSSSQRPISEPTSSTVALFLAIQTYLFVPLLPTYDHCLNTIALFGLPIQNRISQFVEPVQRRFTKRLQGYSGYSYEKRLQLLNLQKLEIRRI